jgi:hypothetical protein
MCSTIASATMSRSVSVSGRRLLPTLNFSANRTSLVAFMHDRLHEPS